MRIIEKVKIHYFRSINDLEIDCKDINVFVGANDTGKSNILRALNLFFNDRIDFMTSLNPEVDIAKQGVQKARERKHKLVLSIGITFNNVDKWQTIPDQFELVRIWDRNGKLHDEKYTPKTFENTGKKILLPHINWFKNRIKFHYVPAVKDSNTFSYYLGELHDTIMQKTARKTTKVREVAQELSENVTKAIKEMTEAIKKNLDIESTIKVPEDLRSIFENLDFSTTESGNEIPLKNRGDGIQARHIPFIINFLSEQDSLNHIWGYEEPENSLEMMSAFKLADQFKEDFSKENQIFLTTHSPAFYDITGEHVARWHIKSDIFKYTKNDGQVIDYKISKESRIDTSDDVDKNLGIAELVRVKAREIYEENKRIKKINQDLLSLTKPVLITEGKNDALILKTAWGKLYPKCVMPFEIYPCNVAPIESKNDHAGVKLLSQYLESTLQSEKNLRIGVFDNDEAGKKYHKKLSHFGQEDNKKIRKHQNGKAYAIILPQVSAEDTEEYWDKDEYPIEFLFSKKYLTSNYVKPIYFLLKDKKSSNECIKVSKEYIDELEEKLPSLICKGFIKEAYCINRKKLFAEKKVPTFPPDAFKNFKPLFEMIKNIIEEYKKKNKKLYSHPLPDEQ